MGELRNALRRFMTLLVLYTIIIHAYLGVGCHRNQTNGIQEIVPDITSAAKKPELEPYKLEFARASLKSEIAPPFDIHLINGQVDTIDHNTNCLLWLVMVHTGTNFFDGQKLMIYSDKSHNFSEFDSFAGKRVTFAVVISNVPDSAMIVLASVWPEKAPWWSNKIYVGDLKKGDIKELTDGARCKSSVDHSKVAFWRTNGRGFHSLHLWNAKSGNIDNIISMLEVSPESGSGTSWDIAWSEDSKALNIRGECGGFYEKKKPVRMHVNLIYMVEQKSLYSF